MSGELFSNILAFSTEPCSPMVVARGLITVRAMDMQGGTPGGFKTCLCALLPQQPTRCTHTRALQQACLSCSTAAAHPLAFPLVRGCQQHPGPQHTPHSSQLTGLWAGQALQQQAAPKAKPVQERWSGDPARQEALAWATARLSQPEEAAADHWLHQLRCTKGGCLRTMLAPMQAAVGGAAAQAPWLCQELLGGPVQGGCIAGLCASVCASVILALGEGGIAARCSVVPVDQTALAECLAAGYPDSAVHCADLLWETLRRLVQSSWGNPRRRRQPPRRARPRNSLPRCARGLG